MWKTQDGFFKGSASVIVSEIDGVLSAGSPREKTDAGRGRGGGAALMKCPSVFDDVDPIALEMMASKAGSKKPSPVGIAAFPGMGLNGSNNTSTNSATSTEAPSVDELRGRSSISEAGGSGTARSSQGGALFQNRSAFVPDHGNQLQVFQHYQVAESVGAGSHGAVCKVVHKETGVQRAMKVLNKEKEFGCLAQAELPRELLVEVHALLKLDHPNVCRLVEIYEDNTHLYLVMELCMGGELFGRLTAKRLFQEPEARDTMRQLLSVIAYCHSVEILHRDIKPENLLYATPEEDSALKLIDFGFAVSTQEADNNVVGSPYYLAPEIAKKEGSVKASDVWSCGVVAFVLLGGYPPFMGSTVQATLQAIVSQELVFPTKWWNHVSPLGIEFIRSMLDRNPSARPSAQAALAHKWMMSDIAAPVRSAAEIQDCMDRFTSFRSQQKMRKIALSAVAPQLTGDALEELRKTFVKFDVDQSGTLSQEEFRKAMEASKIKVPADLMEVFQDLDTDGSRCVEYSEFLAAAVAQRDYQKEEMCFSVFRVFDTTHDGLISVDELQRVVGQDTVFDSFSSQSILDIIKEVDKDGDQQLSFEEFLAMMRKTT